MISKEIIQNKAQELFFSYGIRNVSMNDLSTALSISKKTLYMYYIDKESIIIEMVQKEIDSCKQHIEEDYNNSKDAIHEIFLSLNRILNIFKRLNNMVLYDLKKYHPAVYQFFDDYKQTFLLSSIKKNLIRGIAEELYDAHTPINIIAKYRLDIIFLAFSPEWAVFYKDNSNCNTCFFILPIILFVVY